MCFGAYGDLIFCFLPVCQPLVKRSKSRLQYVKVCVSSVALLQWKVNVWSQEKYVSR